MHSLLFASISRKMSVAVMYENMVRAGAFGGRMETKASKLVFL